MGLIVKVAVTALALWLAVVVVEGLDFDGNGLGLLVVALVFGLVNVLVKPIVKLLSLPLVIFSLGLFLLVINALMLALTINIAGVLGVDLTSTGFLATFLGAVVVSVVTWVAELVTGMD